MTRDDEEAARAALEAEARGGHLLERLIDADADREARSDPIFPDAGDVELELREATDLAKGFRSLRDAHSGELAVPRSVLPGDPRRVAAAIMLEMESDLEELRGRNAKSRQRRGAEDLVDLQSFRREDEVRSLNDKDVDPNVRAAALESLVTARAVMITWIRNDPSILGSINAMRGLDIRVGDGRIALDAVNRDREHQALGLLAWIVIPIVVVVFVVVVLFVSGRL